jgi:hypothetical protein
MTICLMTSGVVQLPFVQMYGVSEVAGILKGAAVAGRAEENHESMSE